MLAIEEKLRTAIRLHEAGNFNKAELLYRELLEVQQPDPRVIHALGVVLLQAGRYAQAIVALKRSVELDPCNVKFIMNFGVALGFNGNLRESVRVCRQAVELKPECVEARANLGLGLERLGRFDAAVDELARAIQLEPTYFPAHVNLGNALRRSGKPREAVKSFVRGNKIKPTAMAFNGLAQCHIALGQCQQTLECLRQSRRLEPNDHKVGSVRLLTLLHDQSCTPEAFLSEARKWASRFAEPLSAAAPPHRDMLPSDRRLRIGYVSGDFRRHPVARFIQPILQHHDREAFEVFCYSNVARPDSITRRLKKLAEVSRDISVLDDKSVVQQIRDDQIDVLIDLSGHTRDNRLLVFARRPAPIQISYLGFPGTTGMSAIQYRLTDAIADPPGAERAYTEQLVRMPSVSWCYCPTAAPVTLEPPVAKNGFITFGAMHRPLKINAATATLYRRVLEAVPGSKLLVSTECGKGDAPQPASALTECGIDPSRIMVARRAEDHAVYLDRYNRCDIILDVFPYNGTTTTCDALWMGVPVMTMAGEVQVSRAGASLLSAVGATELIADSPDDFLRRVTELGNSRSKLRGYRRTLRLRMETTFVKGAAQWCREYEGVLSDLGQMHYRGVAKCGSVKTLSLLNQ